MVVRIIMYEDINLEFEGNTPDKFSLRVLGGVLLGVIVIFFAKTESSQTTRTFRFEKSSCKRQIQQEQMTKLKQENTMLKTDLERKTRYTGVLQHQIQEMTSEVGALKCKNKSLENNLESETRRTGILQVRLETLSMENKQLEERRHDQNIKHSKAMECLLKEKIDLENGYSQHEKHLHDQLECQVSIGEANKEKIAQYEDIIKQQSDVCASMTNKIQQLEQQQEEARIQVKEEGKDINENDEFTKKLQGRLEALLKEYAQERQKVKKLENEMKLEVENRISREDLNTLLTLLFETKKELKIENADNHRDPSDARRRKQLEIENISQPEFQGAKNLNEFCKQFDELLQKKIEEFTKKLNTRHEHLEAVIEKYLQEREKVSKIEKALKLEVENRIPREDVNTLLTLLFKTKKELQEELLIECAENHRKHSDARRSKQLEMENIFQPKFQVAFRRQKEKHGKVDYGAWEIQNMERLFQKDLEKQFKHLETTSLSQIQNKTKQLHKQFLKKLVRKCQDELGIKTVDGFQELLKSQLILPGVAIEA